MKQLTNTDAVAISKALKGDPNKIKAGTYSGEISVRLRYVLRKGEDTQQAATCNILSLPVLAKALVMSGIQVENFMKHLREAAAQSILGNEDGKAVGEVVSDADKRIAAEVERIKSELVAKLPKVPKSGATTLQNFELDVLNVISKGSPVTQIEDQTDE